VGRKGGPSNQARLTMGTNKRYLIVYANDFGLSFGVNRGIIEAHESGIVTSASLMVRWPAAATAAAYAREHPSLGLGLHFDLGEWVYREGIWTTVYEGVPTDDHTAVAEEATRQLAVFRRLLGRDPTHIDSHQHVHRREPARSVLIRIARRLAVPLRHHSAGARHCGDFHGQTTKGVSLPNTISVDGLIEILVGLPSGVTELACHPGLGDNELKSTYRSERAEEVKVLCEPRVRAAILAKGNKLCSFGSDAPRGLNLMP
jgi:chitin disaccharide deacetylase